MTVVDRLGLLEQEPNAHVVLRADRGRFLSMLEAVCARSAGASIDRVVDGSES